MHSHLVVPLADDDARTCINNCRHSRLYFSDCLVRCPMTLRFPGTCPENVPDIFCVPQDGITHESRAGRCAIQQPPAHAEILSCGEEERYSDGDAQLAQEILWIPIRLLSN